MAQLQLTCLGDFLVTLDGAPLTAFQTDKMRALFIYLALERQSHGRDALARFLWPGYLEESARNSFRQYLYQLRRLLHNDESDPPWLLVTRQTVQINPAAAVSTDVTHFQALLAETPNHAHAQLHTCPTCLARLRTAVELYRGDFLAGFTVADSDPFEEWRRIRQEQLHLQALDALRVLMDAAETAGNDEEVLWAARRQLELEPWLESAHRAVMRGLARQGQRAAAIAQYQRCCEVLAAELQATPDAATTALAQQIRNGAFEQAAQRRGSAPVISSPSGTPPAPTLLHDWDEMPALDFFTGRDKELAQLIAWLTPDGDTGLPARLVSILGMGGMGKTTLASAAVRQAAPAYAVVIWRSLLNAPPLDALLRNWLQILSRQTLTALPDALDEQLRLLMGYLRQARCLLVLDNVESIFADVDGEARSSERQPHAGKMRPGYEGYDQLLQRLATSDHQSCLLLTSREQPHSLARLGRQTQEANGRIRILPLTGLDVEASHELLRSNGLRASLQATMSLIGRYSGNPLALQLVSATITDFFGGDVAAFQQEEGAIFADMRAVLDQQFTRLSPLEHDILVWLAIEREAVAAPTLRANLAQPTTTRDLLEALQSLQSRSLLDKSDAGLGLQNVIIEYATARLVEQASRELLDFAMTPTDATYFMGETKISAWVLNRFAFLKTNAKAYVRQAQIRMILQPIAERLAGRLGKAQIVARIPAMLDALRAARLTSGYAAGNLLNLLVSWEEDLAGYDFSQLPVWQADLRGLIFAAPDFTGADLTNSAFTAGIMTGKIAFRPAGELLVAGLDSGDLCVWRTADGQLTDAFRQESNSRTPLVFSPDGEYLAAAGVDYRIHVHSTASGACVQTLSGHNGAIYALAFSQDGARLASGGGDHLVCLWDVPSGCCLQRLPGYTQGVDALAFSPDGRVLATGGGDGVIRLWRADAAPGLGRLLATLPGHDHALGALAFSPDGAWLASGDHNGLIQLWATGLMAGDLDEKNFQLAQRWPGHASIVRALLFVTSPAVQEDGSAASKFLLASCSADQSVRLWSLAGQPRFTLLGHTHEVGALSVSPDGRNLASCGADQRIFLWDLRTGQMLDSLQAHRAGVNSVRFSPDGQRVASGGADRLVRLWRVEAGASSQPTNSAPPRCLRGHTRFIRTLAFSASGRMLASGGADGVVRIWDSESGARLHSLTGHNGAVLALAFSLPVAGAENAWLASAGADRIIRLWPMAALMQTGALHPRHLNGHEDEIFSLCFGPPDVAGSSPLVSGGMDGRVYIWDVASGALRHRLPGHTAPVLTCAVSPDGAMLVTIGFDHTLRFWEMTTGRCLRVQRESHIGANTVAFSPDGETLAYGGDDYAVYLWRWRSDDAPFALRGHTGAVTGLDFSPTAPLLVSSSHDGSLRLWDVPTRVCRQLLRAPGPYAGMKIIDATGISDAQKAALRALGAVENATMR